MDIVPTNSDLPISFEPPGVYFQLRVQGGGSVLADAFRRVFIWGHKLSSGTAAVDAPTRCSSASDAFLLAGQGSDLARGYQAYASQAGNGVADVYLIPITEPSSGTQATRKIIFAGSITTAGSFDVWICGYLHSIRASTSDTPTTLGDALAAAINANANLPCTASNTSGTVTLTYRHKGLVGNDLPIIVNQTNASGITVSAGTLTYATAPSGSAGSATVTIGSVTISASVDPAVQTTAALAATQVFTAINGAGNSPVTATDNGSGVITLYYKSDRVVNKISAAIVTVGGVTVTVACGTVAANSGTERPTLTTALANLANFAGGGRLWLSPWFNTTTIGTMESHIELYQNGLYQRDQYLFVGSNDGIVTAGGIPSGTSPALTAKYRYTVANCPDSPQQGFEEAARCVGMIAAEDYVPKNYDGAELVSDGIIPNLAPHPAVRLGPQSDDAQTAMHTYGLTPIAVTADGRKVVVKGRTTDLTPVKSGGVPDWGVAQHLGFLRVQFVQAGSQAIQGKSIRLHGTPKSENTITPIQVKSRLVARARDLDLQDLFDGVDDWKDSFTITPDSNDPTRLNGFIPLAVIRPAHQLGLVGAPV